MPKKWMKKIPQQELSEKDIINYHSLDTGEVLEIVNSDPTNGLSEEEVKNRLEEYGQNILVEKGRTNPVVLFFKQFSNILIILLIIAAVISAAVAEEAPNDPMRYVESIVIFAILIINAVIGFIQEYQAEKSLEELKKMVSKDVRVIRSGVEHIISSKDLVPGDIVLIEAGEKVPSDMRLLETTSLKVDESVLTGESVSLSKDSKQIINPKAIVGDRRNMLFMGTTITYGRAKAVVIGTGMITEMGKIATLMQKEKEEPTPLQKNLNKLGKVLAIIIVVICIIVFSAMLIEAFILKTDIPWKESLITALALAVSAVPEGLPAAITLTYAIGVRLMAKHKAIVSRLPAVETLGIVDVICSDKTGTLTKNEMTVTEVQTIDHIIKVTGAGFQPFGEFFEDENKINANDNFELKMILRTSLLCNNSKINYNEKTKEIETIGDPTEVALIVLAKKGNFYDEVDFPREVEIFFDSQRKRMTTVNRQLKKIEFKEDLVAYSKGSPAILLERCSYVSMDGKVSPIDEGIKKTILEKNDDMAARALRVLALAYRIVDERLIKVDSEDFLSQMEENIESDLIFLGLVGMIDPARPEVKYALEKCHTAGIKVVMVTGDQKVTAEAIAKDIGLIKGKEWLTIIGSELEETTDQELLENLDDVKIFARVSPEHKYRIVGLFQEKNHIVATTGDGVNDAPAIKKAEIGVAMGIQGTDVTREAAQIVLADDNFATIVTAVERGRTIFQNMLKFIRYLIASNFDEILTVFFCVVILRLPSPFTAIQILWINLVTDGLPAIALSVDPPFADIMRKPPRKKKESFMKDIYLFSVIAGLLAFAAGMCAFVPMAYMSVDPTAVSEGMKNLAFFLANVDSIGELSSEQWLASARASNFTISIVFEMFNVFITRSGFERSSFTINPFNNKWIWVSIVVAMGLQMFTLYTPIGNTPNGVYNTVFDTMPLDGQEWGYIIGLCIVAASIMELSKFIVGKFILKKWTGVPKRLKKEVDFLP